MFSCSILAQWGTPCRTPGPYPAETRSGMGLLLPHQFAFHWKRSHALLCVWRNPGASGLPTHPELQTGQRWIIHSFYLMCVQKAGLDERPSICAFSVKTGSGFCVCFSCEGPWGASGGGVEGKAEHHVGNQFPYLPPCHPSPRGGKQSTQPETWLCSGRAGKAGSGKGRKRGGGS